MTGGPVYLADLLNALRPLIGVNHEYGLPSLLDPLDI